jgi:CDGSH-type Zn-finger protein
MTAFDLTYVLPIKRADEAGPDDELTDYLRWLARRARVVVVDGSPDRVFATHAEQWAGLVEHVRVSSQTPNGKVAGVCDGVAAAATTGVVVADDDVRYDDASLAAVAHRLERHAVVMPQNYFDPAPWHARWDTGRSLLNRALGADYAGTVAMRRSAFMAMGGYCGNVLFENLELMRTARANGHDVHDAVDVFVARRPPTVRQFADQRVRQAYDSWAQPMRMAVELALLPTLVATAVLWPAGLVGLAGAVVALAEVGRRRAGGRSAWSGSASLWSLGWTVERSITAWLAVVVRCRGGVRYRGRRLRVAAHRIGALGAGCPEKGCVCRIALRARDDRAAAYTVTDCPGGPLLVRGAAGIRDSDGAVHEVTRRVVAVCRCDRSARRPWCDGTHKVARARGAQRADAGEVEILTPDDLRG